MPSTAKAPAKSSSRPQATKATCARLEKGSQKIERIGQALAAAQKDLSAIGDSLGKGAGDMSKDVTKLLHDARRDVTKLGKLVRRDIEHLQKDVSAAAGEKPAPRRRSTTSRAKPAAAARARRPA